MPQRTADAELWIRFAARDSVAQIIAVLLTAVGVAVAAAFIRITRG